KEFIDSFATKMFQWRYILIYTRGYLQKVFLQYAHILFIHNPVPIYISFTAICSVMGNSTHHIVNVNHIVTIHITIEVPTISTDNLLFYPVLVCIPCFHLQRYITTPIPVVLTIRYLG